MIELYNTVSFSKYKGRTELGVNVVWVCFAISLLLLLYSVLQFLKTLRKNASAKAPSYSLMYDEETTVGQLSGKYGNITE